MNYELAKQLKDAGFPQKGSGICQKHEQVYSMHLISDPDYHYCDDFACIPTLEELIEACGDKIENLYQNVAMKGTGWHWSTNYVYDDGSEYNDFAYSSDSSGSTPSEAVAKLWLSLKNNE